MSKREEAARNGEKFYFGLKCRNCNESKRYTINCVCVKCQNERSKISVKKRRMLIKQMIAANTKTEKAE